MLWVKAFHIIFMVTWFAGLVLLTTLVCLSRHDGKQIAVRAVQSDGTQATYHDPHRWISNGTIRILGTQLLSDGGAGRYGLAACKTGSGRRIVGLPLLVLPPGCSISRGSQHPRTQMVPLVQ